MIIRLAEINDVDKIMEIIEEARLDLKILTKCQWQFGYPNRDSFLKDISLNQLYVGCEEEVVMVAALVQGVEPTYNQIYNGKWLQNEEYLTIHRIAVSKKYCHRGYAEQMIEYAKKMCEANNIKSIRVDTHYTNIPMNKLLVKAGFTLVGEIYLSEIHDYNNVRNAYELLI